MFELVRDLLDVEADVVVTITAPLDRRRPGQDEDRIRLRNLVADARSRVLEVLDEEAAQPLLDNLERAVAGLDLRRAAHGAVVVATDEVARAELVPYPVREAVAIGPTPATRFLVQGLRRSPRYRVLVVSDRSARLFEAVRDELVEVEDHGFPFAADLAPRDRRAVAGRFALAPGGDDREPWRKFFREVDDAMTAAAAGDDTPIVLAGVRRSTAEFEEVSRNRRFVVGHLDGAHERTSTSELGRAAWQIMRERLKDRRRQVVGELVDGFHAGRAVLGIGEAWRPARQGRGRLLVVEEGYRAEPSREVDGHLVPGDGDGAVEDPVDELIEHVVRAGGDVEFVADGALADHGHLGLLLRAG